MVRLRGHGEGQRRVASILAQSGGSSDLWLFSSGSQLSDMGFKDGHAAQEL